MGARWPVVFWTPRRPRRQHQRPDAATTTRPAERPGKESVQESEGCLNRYVGGDDQDENSEPSAYAVAGKSWR